LNYNISDANVLCGADKDHALYILDSVQSNHNY